MASKLKNLVLATISLDRMAGGLEKNIVNLANNMHRRGHKVHLVTFDHDSATSFYPLDAGVIWHKTGRTPVHGKISFSERLALITRIRSIIQNAAPASIICFHHGILARFFLASLFTGCKLICSERNSLSLYNHVRTKLWNLNFLLLHACHRITVQFAGYARDYPASLRKRITCIPNPVFPVTGEAKPDQPNSKGRFSLLSVTRLCDQKNIQALIRAFANIQTQFPDWDLDIVGDGVSQAELESLIQSLNLQTRITLHGKQDQVGQYYQAAHLFCLPSKWEGFPNAMAEAMSYALPVIGYAGCRGTSDLVNDNITGFLAAGNGNIDSLTKTLEKLMSDPALRVKTGQTAKREMQNYTPERVYDLWETIL